MKTERELQIDAYIEKCLYGAFDKNGKLKADRAAVLDAFDTADFLVEIGRQVVWFNPVYQKAFASGRIPLHLSKKERHNNKINPER